LLFQSQLQMLQSLGVLPSSERRCQARASSTPRLRLKSFIDSDSNRCHFCYGEPYILTCSKICQAPMRIDMSSTISDIRALIKEYEQQKEQIEALKKENEEILLKQKEIAS
jgi:hypothetical protein